jgi:hypothetical protein
VGIEWASRVTTIGLEFALPPLLGYGVDSWLRTTPVATITGAVLGFATGMMHTVSMVRQLPGQVRGRADQRFRDGRGPHSSSRDANET